MDSKKQKQLIKLADDAPAVIFNDEEESREDFLNLVAFFFFKNFETVLLIFQQYRRARKLKTFEEWKQEGRHIKKGEKSIYLIEKIGVDHLGNTRYKTENVFDISQTAGEGGKDNRKIVPKSFFTSLVERYLEKFCQKEYADVIRYVIYKYCDITCEIPDTQFFSNCTQENFRNFLEGIQQDTKQIIKNMHKKLRMPDIEDKMLTLDGRFKKMEKKQTKTIEKIPF